MRTRIDKGLYFRTQVQSGFFETDSWLPQPPAAQRKALECCCSFPHTNKRKQTRDKTSRKKKCSVGEAVHILYYTAVAHYTLWIGSNTIRLSTTKRCTVSLAIKHRIAFYTLN